RHARLCVSPRNLAPYRSTDGEAGLGYDMVFESAASARTADRTAAPTAMMPRLAEISAMALAGSPADFGTTTSASCKTDGPRARSLCDIRFEGQSGRDVLGLSFSLLCQSFLRSEKTMIENRATGEPEMRRREFILLLGGGAIAWPLAVRAELQPKMLRVGFVGMLPREAPLYTNFLKRMAELGYQEGRNFTFDYIQTPNIEGYEKNYRELAARKVD